MKFVLKWSAVLLLLSQMTTLGFARRKKASHVEPVQWGMISHNTGCVIFKEGHKTSGMFWGVAITTKVRGKLTVIETEHYTMDQKVIVETQANLDALMQRAQRDDVKYVKIPEKYSPELLKRARDMCRQNQ